jgi:FkbM family methyltransferase
MDFHRLRRRLARSRRHWQRYLTDPPYRQHLREFAALRQAPSRTAGSVHVYGQPLRFLDARSFLFLHDEIVEREIYRFRCTTATPRIIDGGANIGLATVYFKHQYPGAIIDAFEPDPENFAVLQANCRLRGLTDVRLHPCALWTAAGTLRFRCEPSTLGGRLANADPSAGDLEVPTVRLRDLLTEPIHFLKLDVEGAETELLEDCADRLSNVEAMFVEYHSFADRPQSLHRLLTVIHQAGFRAHFHVFEPAPQPLWERPLRVGIDRLDMNLDIFCYRP